MYRDLCSGHLGTIKTTHYTFEVKEGTRPIRQELYRPEQRSWEVRPEHLEKLLETFVIKPAQSESACRNFLIPIQDRIFQICVDYRRLNDATISNTYSLPRMNVCIEKLEKVQLFWSLDALWGWRKVPMKGGDEEKTQFTSHLRTHRYPCMPLGSRNEHVTFSCAMDTILSGSNERRVSLM